ncbi:MAG TPA: ParA family protein [Acetobacteraceae bacterium]|nr:ParA family protein [Acetobacteraceae bacterium]HQU00838.1 ParA family protein [Acetobacteraceae bacterium]
MSQKLDEMADRREPASGSGPRVIAVANQKGGVGKTTTAINLATALAVSGEQVLLIDLDPQGNASTSLGITSDQRGGGSYALLAEHQLPEDVTLATSIPNLGLIPAISDLLGADLEFAAMPGREFLLRTALTRSDAARRTGYVIIDCPPGLTLLTLNALVAADSVLVPLQCEFLALEGLSQLMQTINLVRGKLNPALALEGIVLTMMDRRNNLSEQVADDVRSHFKDKVFTTTIPRNIRISEAPSHGKPVLFYDFRSAGAQAYVALAAEFLARQRAKTP